MEPDAPLAPPVVAVVVVHAPGPWFEETLDSLVDQDYPNLNTLFLLTGGPLDADGADLEARILARLPEAFVRDLGDNPGFGPAANEVLRLVEGDAGFFCFCHDDIALEPDAIRLLVEELYRSNAGMVGPKLVAWDDPGVLQHVGLGMDRFGEIDPITEPGEYDQEQHDAVRDVFVLPSACLLVRADLFRVVGGFDPGIDFHGDDVDLCWRVHLSGARVLVAPQATVRHREQLDVRRPDLNHRVLQARHRMRTVATLTGGRRLATRSVEMVLLTVAELVVGLFTGRFGEAWASLRALVGLVPRTPALLARRGAIAKIRQVPDGEVMDLQNRGSARLTSYLRSRDTETFVGEETSVKRWRESTLASTLIWIVVVIGIIAASRTFIDTRVPAVGELLPLPESPRSLWNDFAGGWNPNGLGGSAANPTGWGVLSLFSLLWGFRMGLGLTVIVVGLVVLGVVGTWRLAMVFPSSRARLTALVVYAAVPLVPGVISTGRLSALVAYATVPWFVHLLRSAVGIGTADPQLTSEQLVDGILDPPVRERIRRTAVLGIVIALGVAMAPAMLVVVVIVTVVLGLTSLGAGAGWRTAMWFTVLGLTGAAGAYVLNLPWSATLSWRDVQAPELAGAPGRGLAEIVSMGIGGARLEILAIALYVPVLAALAVARSWRLTWAARAGGLVAVFTLLAVLQDRDALPFALPDVGLLLVPVALGMAISSATAVASFADDVAGRGFGWRQPIGLAALGAVVIGCLPAVLTVMDGAWFTPRTTLDELTAPYLAADDGDGGGDDRVLFLGDPRLIPVPSTDLGDGVGMGVVDAGRLDARDRWPAADDETRTDLAAIVRDIATDQTLRGGRLLAPFGVRYIVIPVADGATSTLADPLPIPVGLVRSLQAQLDMARERNPSAFVVFENTAAMPTVSALDAAVDEASRADTLDSLLGVDTGATVPVLAGALDDLEAAGDVPAGTIHLGVGFDDHWQLAVGGADVDARPAFGVTTAFDVATAGLGELTYRTPGGRAVALAGQAVLWLVALVLASRLGIPRILRRTRAQDETLLDLDDEAGADLPDLEESGLGGWVEELLERPTDEQRDGVRP